MAQPPTKFECFSSLSSKETAYPSTVGCCSSVTVYRSLFLSSSRHGLRIMSLREHKNECDLVPFHEALSIFSALVVCCSAVIWCRPSVLFCSVEKRSYDSNGLYSSTEQNRSQNYSIITTDVEVKLGQDPRSFNSKFCRRNKAGFLALNRFFVELGGGLNPTRT